MTTSRAGGPPFRRSGDFVAREIAGETILVPIRGDVAQLESIFTMNDSASTLWAGLTEGLDEEALAARLVERFDVTPDEARADVRAFLGTLEAEGLVVRARAEG